MNHPLTILRHLLAALVLIGPGLAVGADVAAYFSPNGGCTAALVDAIDQAVTSIDIQAYQLTSDELIGALARAHRRDVMVRVLIDPTQEGNNSRSLRDLATLRVPIRTDSVEKILHNKTAVIDARRTITGSFNWTHNAERHNAENLLIIDDQATAAAFRANFQTHWEHSRNFSPRPLKQPTTKPRLPRSTNPNPRP